MARRPVFIVNEDSTQYVLTEMVEFKWFPGVSARQKQKSVHDLHEKASSLLHDGHILEISTKSTSNLGTALSSFNLRIITKTLKRNFSVESAYQASKVFQNGGPYRDILQKSSKEAKRDPRIRNSGSLKYFIFDKTEWPLYPPTMFYDWLYINALSKRKDLTAEIVNYIAFTDIEFNPHKSVSSQAHSAALFVSLFRRGLLDQALSSKMAFVKIVAESLTVDCSKNSNSHFHKQLQLFNQKQSNPGGEDQNCSLSERGEH